MPAAVRIPVEQRSPEWLEARRSLITATDLPILLGLSPYKCEADLAAEKAGGDGTEPTLRMRIGQALEPLIAEQYAAETGRRVRRFHGLLRHPEIEWAAASPDYGVVGERRLVEIKWTGSRSRFADGLPADIEAQVAWQLMVTDYPRADVAALVGDDLRIFEVGRDLEMERGLVVIATDFRRRLAAGGPFAQSNDSLKRRYPTDDGSELVADGDVTEAVLSLAALRARRKSLQDDEERLEVAIKDRMGDAAVMTGPGFRVTWRRTKDVEQTDWRRVAEAVLPQLSSETEREALVGQYTSVRPGFRPFRLVMEGEPE